MKQDVKFEFGTVTVPDGESGDWKVSTFSIAESDVMLMNLRAMRDGNPEMIVHAGEYKRLTCKGRGVVMSNTNMEILTAVEAFENATGHVFVNGLGLGMVLEGILSKDDVKTVTVMESEIDVINLVAPHFKHDERVKIIHGDAYEYKPSKTEFYDYVWHDIWDTLCSDNLPLMAQLTRKFGRYSNKQGAWSRDMVRREKRRWG